MNSRNDQDWHRDRSRWGADVGTVLDTREGEGVGLGKTTKKSAWARETLGVAATAPEAAIWYSPSVADDLQEFDVEVGPTAVQ